jgi:hypothetical protein
MKINAYETIKDSLPELFDNSNALIKIVGNACSPTLNSVSQVDALWDKFWTGGLPTRSMRSSSFRICCF